eukprot:g3272.t1
MGNLLDTKSEELTRVKQLTKQYEMEDHPEGGWYKEVYRSDLKIETPWGLRNSSTAIVFLVTPGNVSRLHRLNSDEAWHFYEGGPLTIVEFIGGGTTNKTKIMRKTTLSKENPFHMVKAGNWFGCYPASDQYVFVGCTVSPGFDFNDFELASNIMMKTYFQNPSDGGDERRDEYYEIIDKLTKGLP